MLSFTCQVCVVGERIDGMAHLYVRLYGDEYNIPSLLHADLLADMPQALILDFIKPYRTVRRLSLQQVSTGFWNVYAGEYHCGFVKVTR